MEVQAEVQLGASREFWRGALVAGGFTAIPRWSLDATIGTAEHEAKIPDDLVVAVRRLADELGVSVSSVLLAAHAKVLAALSGEREVATGYVGRQGGQPLPCRLTTEPDSWRALLLATHQAESELQAHSDFPVDDLRRDLSLSGPFFETVFDPTGFDRRGSIRRGSIEPGSIRPVSRMTLPRTSCCGSASRAAMNSPRMRLRYRTDVLDADSAARIAGYHLTALELMAVDVGAVHRRQSLLSVQEFFFQLEGLAGPRRALPDLRVHELFEQQVGAHPDRRRRGVRRVAA